MFVTLGCQGHPKSCLYEYIVWSVTLYELTDKDRFSRRIRPELGNTGRGNTIVGQRLHLFTPFLL